MIIIIIICSVTEYNYCCSIFHRDTAFIKRTLDLGDTEALEILGGVWSSLHDTEAGGQRPKSWEDCVRWARCKWETLFNNEIRQLLHCFPPDEVKKQLSWCQKCNMCNLSPWTHRGTVVQVRYLHSKQWNTKVRYLNNRNCIFHISLHGVLQHISPRVDGNISPAENLKSTTDKQGLLRVSEGFLVCWNMQTERCHMLLSYLWCRRVHRSVST